MPEAMADASRQVEHVELARVPQLRDLGVDRTVEVGEVSLHLFGAEEVVRERAPLGEELVRHLAHEHPIVGESLARVALGDRVERGEANLAEGEEIGDSPGLDHERVAEPSPRFAQCDHRVGNRGRIPRQLEPGARRARIDGTHPGSLSAAPAPGKPVPRSQPRAVRSFAADGTIFRRRGGRSTSRARSSSLCRPAIPTRPGSGPEGTPMTDAPISSGTGTADDPWRLKTPPLSSDYTMHRDTATAPR